MLVIANQPILSHCSNIVKPIKPILGSTSAWEPTVMPQRRRPIQRFPTCLDPSMGGPGDRDSHVPFIDGDHWVCSTTKIAMLIRGNSKPYPNGRFVALD